MPNLIDQLGAQAVQDNSANPVAGIQSGLQQGLQAAQMQQSLKAQQQQAESQQIDLDQKKLNAMTGVTTAWLFAPDSLSGVARKRAEETARQLNVPFDADFFDAVQKDPDRKLAMQKILGGLRSGEGVETPEQVQQALGGFGDSQVMSAAASRLVTQNVAHQQEVSEADDKASAAQDVADTRAKALAQAAQIRADAKAGGGGGGGPSNLDVKVDTAKARALKSMTNDTQVVGYQKSIQQAKKDYDLIQTSKTEGLDPLKRSELVQSYVSLLKGQAAGSVGSEREELEHSANDLQSRGASWLQRVQGQGFVKYKDDPFLQEMESNVKNIHNTIKNGLDNHLDELTRDSELPGINEVQAAARAKIMKNAELGGGPTASAAAAAPSVPVVSDAKKLKLQALVSSGTINPQTKKPYTQADIAPYLK